MYDAEKPRLAPMATNRKKWTHDILSAGWTLVPNVLIERQAELKLSPLDLNIILHLLARWWVPEIRPRPAKSTIAKAMNVSTKTVQRRIAAMERAGLLERLSRPRSNNMVEMTNIYDLTGLIKAAKPFALQMSEEKAEKRRTRRAQESAVIISNPVTS